MLESYALRELSLPLPDPTLHAKASHTCVDAHPHLRSIWEVHMLGAVAAVRTKSSLCNSAQDWAESRPWAHIAFGTQLFTCFPQLSEKHDSSLNKSPLSCGSHRLLSPFYSLQLPCMDPAYLAALSFLWFRLWFFSHLILFNFCLWRIPQSFGSPFFYECFEFFFSPRIIHL